MKKELIGIIICILLIFTAVFPATGNVISKSTKLEEQTIVEENRKNIESKTGTTTNMQITIYVDDDNTKGPWDGTIEHPYQCIQDGVDASVDGDEVFVFSGDYNENVKVKKSIDLIGEERETTSVFGTVSLSDATGLSMRNFTITVESGDFIAKLHNSSNCIIADNNIIAYIIATDGFLLCLSSSNLIEGNTIKAINYVNGNRALNIYGSSYNTISGNFVSGWSDGIDIFSPVVGSDNNLISKNTITDNDCGMFILQNPKKNVISENIIVNNTWGIIMDFFCRKNVITKNEIINNKYAIIIHLLCFNNKIVANNIADSILGVSISSSVFSFNNYFYYNNFQNITDDATDYMSNRWFKREGFFRGSGNYWDDYTGVDDNGDGIGDTPYYISGGKNKDKYPFMEPVDIDDVNVAEFINEAINEVTQESSQTSNTALFNNKCLINNLILREENIK